MVLCAKHIPPITNHEAVVGTVTDILLGPVWDIQKFTLSNVKLLIILHQLMFTVDSGKDGTVQIGQLALNEKTHCSAHAKLCDTRDPAMRPPQQIDNAALQASV